MTSTESKFSDLPVPMSSNPMSQNLQLKKDSYNQIHHFLTKSKKVASVTQNLRVQTVKTEANCNLELRNRSAHLHHNSCKPRHTLLHS
jgi:hypothetical protein